MSEALLATPLLARHLGLGARMVPFGGWNMPVQYSEGILAEHKHCREHVALFDICHMGEFRIRGNKAAADLDRILGRSVLNQAIGSCRYNFLLNEAGGVLDDLIVYRLGENEFYLVVNAGPRAGDAVWLQKYLSSDTSFCDESDATGKLDLQGPEAADVLLRLGVAKESLPAYYHWQYLHVQGVPVLLSRTGYTGELGYELYFPAEKAEFLWDCLLQDASVKPAGLGARDTLRLEMGYPLYGHEMDAATSPLEAGFGVL
ncbi:MAG: glycine cleavage system aminomethyltransferase GcvT, partial [Lentisphaeria bacterium]